MSAGNGVCGGSLPFSKTGGECINLIDLPTFQKLANQGTVIVYLITTL